MHSHMRAKHPCESGGPSSQQQSIASFATRRRTCDDRRAEQTASLISKMIAKDMLPISFVEDRAFTKLLDARTLELTDNSWSVMEELMNVLHSLKHATTALCGESAVSISMVYPVTATLISKHLKENEGESPKVSQFKRSVSASLERRLAPTDVCSAGKVAYIASFLDPRHKPLRFTSDDVKVAVQAKVSDLLSSRPEPELVEAVAVEPEETELRAKKPRSDAASVSAIAALFAVTVLSAAIPVLSAASLCSLLPSLCSLWQSLCSLQP
uniref:Uncharacterized protein n=1 Tax=Knipowitschia caucasica TaxID=637954 RepID=A0AAV2KTN5_KNICA